MLLTKTIAASGTDYGQDNGEAENFPNACKDASGSLRVAARPPQLATQF